MKASNLTALKDKIQANESYINYDEYSSKGRIPDVMIKDLHAEDIEENCFEVIVRDIKANRKILQVITDQLTVQQDFDMDTGQDILTLKILLNEEYIEENGDIDFMEDFNENY